LISTSSSAHSPSSHPARAAGSRSRAQIRIGTSGWSYDHWVGPFYPRGLAADERLAFYARRFDSAEINNSFYRLPSERTLAVWRETVPDGFSFAVKTSRYITHMKKLKDPRQGLTRFLERIALLEDRLGPVLFQLPPRWHFNGERLEQFLGALGGDFRFVFELRDRSWLNGRTLELLASSNAAFCIYELDGFLTPKEITADFVYVRLHGPNGPYRGDYDQQTLSGWAGAFSAWSARGLDVYCYFDNDEAGYAVANALALRQMLRGGDE
jgi:uncharacterized protein YecE (DUF72 family)